MGSRRSSAQFASKTRGARLFSLRLHPWKLWTCTSALRRNWNVQHCDDELALGLHVLARLGLQELVADDRRDVHNRGTRQPTLGLPGDALDRCNKDRQSLSTGLWGTRVRGSLSRRRRHSTDRVLRATTPEGVSPIIGLVALHLQTPGKLLASPARPPTRLGSVVVVVVKRITAQLFSLEPNKVSQDE